jgi:hypothetical protein
VFLLLLSFVPIAEGQWILAGILEKAEGDEVANFINLIFSNVKRDMFLFL